MMDFNATKILVRIIAIFAAINFIPPLRKTTPKSDFRTILVMSTKLLEFRRKEHNF